MTKQSEYFLRGRVGQAAATFLDIGMRAANTFMLLLGFCFLFYMEFVLGALALQDIIKVSFPLFGWELSDFGFGLGLSTVLSLIVIYTHDAATQHGTRSVVSSPRDLKMAFYVAMAVNLLLDLAYIPVMIGQRASASQIVPKEVVPKYAIMFVVIVVFNLYSQPLRRKMLNVFRHDGDEDDDEATITPLTEVA